MKKPFVHFEPQQLRRVESVTARGSQAQLAHFLQRVDDAAETARLLYGGWLPVESLTSCWGTMVPLPWSDDYASECGNCIDIQPFDRAEILNYIYPLDANAPMMRFGRVFERFSGAKRLTQALAIEAVMFLDCALVHLARDEVLAAVSWLGGAYEALLDAINVVSDDCPDVWQYRFRERQSAEAVQKAKKVRAT